MQIIEFQQGSILRKCRFNSNSYFVEKPKIGPFILIPSKVIQKIPQSNYRFLGPFHDTLILGDLGVKSFSG